GKSRDGYLICRIATKGSAGVEWRPFEDLDGRSGQGVQEVGRSEHIHAIRIGRATPRPKVVGSASASVAIGANIKEQSIRFCGRTRQTCSCDRVAEPIGVVAVMIDAEENVF